MRKFRLLAPALLASGMLAMLLIMGCGGSDDDSTTTSTTTESSSAASTAASSSSSTSEAAAETKEEAKAEATTATTTETTSAAAPAATSGDVAQPQYGGEWTFQSTSPRIGQDPINTTGTGYFYNWGTALSSLLRYKMDPSICSGCYEIIGDLADSWTVDGLDVTLHINPDAKWQGSGAPTVAGLNGRNFTAEDAVFGVKRLAGEGSYHVGYWAAMESVSADGDNVKFKLKYPSATFIPNVAYGFNKMSAPEAVDAGGGNLQNGPTIGTSGFTVDCEVDVQCVYTRNPDFHLSDDNGNQLPYLSQARNIIIPDVQARFAAFRARKLDTHGITAEQRIIIDRQYPEIQNDEIKHYGSWFIHFRNDQAPWNDKRVRQAVSKSIDRQEIYDTIYGGLAHMSLAMAMPAAEAYLPQEEFKKAWKRDCTEAKSLLTAAGFPDGLDAKFWVANYSETTIAVVELMQQQLKECGIRIELFIHDRATYLARVFTRHGEFEDMAYGPQGIFTADQWLSAYYHSEGGRNSSWTDDPELDKMIDAQRQQMDPAKRNQELLDIQAYLLDQTYQAVILTGYSRTSHQPYIKNYAYSSGLDYPGRRHVEHIWVDKDEYLTYRNEKEWID
ncbi:MAG: hypothetical protein CL785_00985 [Chloroflexi bacterium]|nr:hypothetical protein [Chloroflexota bacterium]